MDEHFGEADRPGGCLPRLFWGLIGNAILWYCTLLIQQQVYGQGFFSPLDIIYWATVGAMVIIRFADIRYLHGETYHGEPATMSHFRRYLLLMPIVALGIWILAHALAGVDQ